MIPMATEDSPVPIPEESNDQNQDVEIAKLKHIEKNKNLIVDQDYTVEDCESAAGLDPSPAIIREDTQFDEDIYDPAYLSGIRLTSIDIEHGLKLEEQSLEAGYEFPVVNNRKFSPNWSFYNLPDGTKKKEILACV